jgi:hypothetical protein
VPINQSRKAIAAVDDDMPETTSPALAAETRRWTPVYIVASPRPGSGKTFLARLLVDFLRLDGGLPQAFDLDPDEGGLTNLRPDFTVTADIADTRGQMALFDALVVGDGVAKVVDVGHAAFERFFAVVEEIGFIAEAPRRSLEPLVMFAADPHPASAQAYDALRRRFPDLVLVPVFNEAITKGQKLREQFPFGRAAAVPLQIPLLPPGLKAHADKGARSFLDFHDTLPVEVPLGGAFELRSWTKRTFLEFRELELRLLLEKLRKSLQG